MTLSRTYLACPSSFHRSGDKADILWYKAGVGEVFMYIMDGLTVRDQGYIRTIADSNWQISGADDYDGDGRTDVFWRNESTGENYLWPMRGMRTRPTEKIIGIVSGPNWRIVQ